MANIEQNARTYHTCTFGWGMLSAELSDYQGAAVLMNLSAQLMAQVPSIGPKLLKQQRMAYLLAAAAGLEVSWIWFLALQDMQ